MIDVPYWTFAIYIFVILYAVIFVVLASLLFPDHLDEYSGPVDIEVGRGDVELKPGKGKLARMDVKSHEGNVDISLPPDGVFDLKASAQQGDINNDFGDGLIAGSEGRENSLHSPKDEGPAIVLNSDRGEISVRKLE